jgi:hypothetical protein
MQYDAAVRTTVDIDPDLHAEALREAAREALRQVLRPVPPVERDPDTGLGVISIGRPVSADEVADVIDD